MAFYQSPPQLGNQYSDDRVLRSYLRRALPEGMLGALEPALLHLGELAGGALYAQQLEERLLEPRHTPFDAWGHRVDHIEVTPLWHRAAQMAAEQGLVATAYEQAHGALSRVHQFALVYLFDPSTDVYTCPLAMTDGAAKTLSGCLARGLTPPGAEAQLREALARLTSRDPARMWTSGQWMTERTGGSDVGLAETEARPDGQGGYRLYGTKWFTSATTSQMALTLARPTGGASQGRGLALFYVELRDAAGRLRGIQINRLKDKLGTRKVPTAELLLEGAPAIPVVAAAAGALPGNGVRHIAPMLNVTRTWNAVAAVAGMRRALALARDYAGRRRAFGALLAEKPLHVDTLAGLQAEQEAAFHLAFRAVELLGQEETGTLKAPGLLRLCTPLCKLTTGRQAVAVNSEVLEACGGAGYVEDTGLPRLLRDAQVLPIWEGTTNVLSLDALRAIFNREARSAAVIDPGEALEALDEEVRGLLGAARDPGLRAPAAAAQAALARARRFLGATAGAAREAGARRCALTLGRAWALALLVRHAQWSLDHEGDGRAAAAARRFAWAGVDLLGPDDADGDDAARLADAQALAQPGG